MFTRISSSISALERDRTGVTLLRYMRIAIPLQLVGLVALAVDSWQGSVIGGAQLINTLICSGAMLGTGVLFLRQHPQRDRLVAALMQAALQAADSATCSCGGE